MIEYPSIINSSKGPREHCIAFDKLDGSNIRIKWTDKKGFCLFGSRHELFDANHPHLGEAINIFKNKIPNGGFYSGLEGTLTHLIEEEFSDEKEIIVFAEFFGAKSFAGIHVKDDPKELVVIDILVGKENKNPKFLLPQDFHRLTTKYGVARPFVVYTGNLTDQFISDVKYNKLSFKLNEGVVCKGTERKGNFRGGVWQCKIKTQDYLNRLFNRFGQKGIEEYGE